MLDRAKFYATLKTTRLYSTLPQTAVVTLEAILDEVATQPAMPVSWPAYMMATAYHEVGAALVPIRENLNYSVESLRKTWPSRFPSDAIAAPYAHNPRKLADCVYGGRNGNTAPDDGWIYRGGGLPQTTFKNNYDKIGKLVGVDLVANPERILEPKIAVAALVLGMVNGIYTGTKLSTWLPGNYVEARRIINADVPTNGVKIAAQAVQFEKALTAAGY